MDDPKETTYLTAEQVAELKQVSRSTIKRATSAGILKSHRIKTKKNQQRFTRRYTLADVERWRSSYFINDTSRTMQQLVRERAAYFEKARDKEGYRDQVPLVRTTAFWDENGDWQKEVAVEFWTDEGIRILRERDLAQVDPNERIQVTQDTVEKDRIIKRLGDTAVYKRAVKKFGKYTDTEPKQTKSKKPAGKSHLQKDFDDWKVEPSEPVESILDIFKNY